MTLDETDLETNLRTRAAADDAGDPATEWRPGRDRSSPTGAVTSPELFRDPKGYSADDYTAAAAELEANGELELAAHARENAAAVQEAATASHRDAAERAWHRQVAEERARTPELGDEASALSRAVQELLREMPALQQSPRGFHHAAAVARAHAQAVELPTLRARLETLTRENERLARLTSIPGSPPARAGRDTEPELSERDLRRLAYEFDSATAL